MTEIKVYFILSLKKHSIQVPLKCAGLYNFADDLKISDLWWCLASMVTLHSTTFINSNFVFKEIHSGISLLPLSTRTANFSFCHVHTTEHEVQFVITFPFSSNTLPHAIV